MVYSVGFVMTDWWKRSDFILPAGRATAFSMARDFEFYF